MADNMRNQTILVLTLFIGALLVGCTSSNYEKNTETPSVSSTTITPTTQANAIAAEKSYKIGETVQTQDGLEIILSKVESNECTTSEEKKVPCLSTYFSLKNAGNKEINYMPFIVIVDDAKKIYMAKTFFTGCKIQYEGQTTVFAEILPKASQELVLCYDYPQASEKLKLQLAITITDGFKKGSKSSGSKLEFEFETSEIKKA